MKIEAIAGGAMNFEGTVAKYRRRANSILPDNILPTQKNSDIQTPVYFNKP
jgi:hypothetical protein